MKIQSPTSQQELRKRRGKILYITQTAQPQHAYAAALLPQVGPGKATKEDVLNLKKVIRLLKSSPHIGLFFLKLDVSSLVIFVYLDAGHNANLI